MKTSKKEKKKVNIQCFDAHEYINSSLTCIQVVCLDALVLPNSQLACMSAVQHWIRIYDVNERQTSGEKEDRMNEPVCEKQRERERANGK